MASEIIKPLAGKVVVITGASSGIGRATALEFARQGADVVVAARRGKALDEVVSECKQLGWRAIAIETDVTDAVAMKQLAVAAISFGGRIDIWVNNAGIGAVGEFTETPIEAHDKVISTNLIGYLHGAHAVLPYFKCQQYGILINTISLGGWIPQPYTVAYSASKFGLRGFSEALRGELFGFSNIHVCDVFPAYIDTPGFQHAANYTGKKVRPIPPVYDADRVANAIVALARRPKKSVTVGTSAVVLRTLYSLFPGSTRRVIKGIMDNYFKRAKPLAVTDGSLFKPVDYGTSISGGWQTRGNKSRQVIIIGSLVVAGVVAGVWISKRKV